MANTTNYNWETPDDTDLVKDGAAAIRTLGNSVDTTTKALNPETTLGDIAYRSATSNTNTRLAIGSAGQVLTVAAGVPSWATPTDQTPLTTKGDVFTFSTVDARLGVGANGTVLTADSGETTGLKWQGFVGVSAKRANVSTALTSGVAYQVALTAENYDTNAFHDNSTNNSRLTIPTGKGGKYLITAMFNNALGSVGSYAIIYFYVNGAQWTADGFREGNIARGNGDSNMTASAVMSLSAGDYVEMYFQQGNTETVNMWFVLTASYLGA